MMNEWFRNWRNYKTSEITRVILYACHGQISIKFDLYIYKDWFRMNARLQTDLLNLSEFFSSDKSFKAAKG